MKKLLLLLCAASILASCKKNNDQVPNVNVNLYVYLNEPSYSSLNAVGNYVYIQGGYKGIIVYRRNIESFAAYERTCPYDAYESAAIVEVDSSGLSLIDKHCGSTFNILDGSVTHGPASTPLRQYAADWDGANVVHIHN